MESSQGIVVQHVYKQFVRTVKAEEDNKKRFFKHTQRLMKNRKEEFYAVSDISFTANPGQIYGVLGPNGAGKTTLLRMLGGILTPTSGKLSMSGYDYATQKEEVKRKIGYLSGNTKLYGRLSPRELFKIFGELYGMNREEVEQAIENVIQLMNMKSFADNKIEHLSTGQMQRTSIARCLIHKPEVYIFDEPTLGLDVLSSKDIISFMKQEREKGKIVLYSTHYMEEAETLCDKILMIHKGKLIAEGTIDEIKEEAKVKYLRDVFVKIAEGEGE